MDMMYACLNHKREYPSKLGFGFRGDRNDGKLDYCTENKMILWHSLTCLNCDLFKTALTEKMG